VGLLDQISACLEDCRELVLDIFCQTQAAIGHVLARTVALQLLSSTVNLLMDFKHFCGVLQLVTLTCGSLSNLSVSEGKHFWVK